jgi:hypothetical protein
VATEVTIVLRFETTPPIEEDLRAQLEDEFDCVVIECEEEDV